MEAIRVFVVDDHPMIRHGLTSMLAGQTEVTWVGDAADGVQAVQAAPPLQPDVILMDLVLPGMDGVATITALRPLLTDARFLVLTGTANPDGVRRAMAAGACGYLLKNASAQALIDAIHHAHRGGRQDPPPPEAAIAPGDSAPHGDAPGADLTQRERELLALMARGLSNQDISTRLAIAMPTVKFHVTNILSKLGADNRTEAVLTALRHRLVALE